MKYKVSIKKTTEDLWEYYSEPLIVEASSIKEAIQKAKCYLWKWRCENERPVSAEPIF